MTNHDVDQPRWWPTMMLTNHDDDHYYDDDHHRHYEEDHHQHDEEHQDNWPPPGLLHLNNCYPFYHHCSVTFFYQSRDTVPLNEHISRLLSPCLSSNSETFLEAALSPAGQQAGGSVGFQSMTCQSNTVLPTFGSFELNTPLLSLKASWDSQ